MRNNKQKKKQTKAITKIDMKGEKAFEGKTKNENEQIYYSLQSQNGNYLFTGSCGMRL